MPPLEPGVVIPDNECYPIKKRLKIRFLSTDCEGNVDEVEVSTMQRKKVPKAIKKDTYISAFEANGFEVCDQENFCRPKRLMRAKLKIANQCPWYGKTVRLEIKIEHTEQSNPYNGVSAPVKFEHLDWPLNQSSVEGSFASNAVDPSPFVDRFPPQAGQPETFDIKFEALEDEGSNNKCGATSIRITAKFTTGNYVILHDAITQVITRNCYFEEGQGGFINEEGVGQVNIFFWIPVGPFNGPFALIRGLVVTAYPIGFV